MRRIAVAVALWCGSCAGPGEIRVGKKAFAEQDVLAELLVDVIEAGTAYGAAAVPCTDTFGCQQALRGGQIDLMVEYTGTGYFYSGIELGDRPISLAALRGAYQPMGLEWLEPLGFDNSYVVAMPSTRARSAGIRTISDLSVMAGGDVRVACPASYLQRPRDGLASLLDRHGLRMVGEPVVIEDPPGRLDATLDGRADVAIVYATDGVLSGLEYAALEDTLDFFPPYEAAVLARSVSLAERAGLREAVATLDRKIDNAAMQRLNYGVEVEGWQPHVIAHRFLRDHDLIESSTRSGHSARPVRIASASTDRLDDQKSRAARATNVVYSDRPVELISVADPIDSVLNGDARLALIGAERFFGGQNSELQRDRRVEAVAVVGTRVFHVVRRAGDSGAPLSGRVGVGVGGSGAADAASTLLSLSGNTPVVYTPDSTLIELVATGKLDAALVFARAGDSIIADGLQSGSLELRGLPEINRKDRLPYLRAARLPANTYPRQDSAVETLSAQVLLAGPARDTGQRPLAAGPVAAVGRKASALAIEEATALSKATGIAEAPDPIVPSAWTSWPDIADTGTAIDARWVDRILNLAVLAFLAWLFALIVKRPE